jgi:phosphoribosyl 1,2-cyclic phosphodiesterase
VAIFLVIIRDMENQNDTITFLGTAGARIMVTKQFLASGGAWLELGGSPGSLVQAVKRKLDPSKLDAILLSHKHIDHSVDINIMVEAMTEGGFKRRGALYAPSDCFGEEGVILPYLRGYPEKVEYLEEGKKYSVGDTVIETPVKHQHPVETYGFIFQTTRATFSWIVDTRYFEELTGHYRGDLIIMNMVLTQQKDFVDHLYPDKVKLIIKQLKPKVAIITHFGMGVWKARPWEIAKTLSDETGVRVLSARDGMKVDLANLETL